MTVDTGSTGTVAEYDDSLMPWEQEGADTLDELKQSEIPTPRLRIIPKEGVFENADTSEKYDSLDVIILGLVRQRIMWGKEVAEGEVPLCRSLDAKTGTPNVDDDVPVKKQFPWSKSNFTRKQLPIIPDTDQPIAPCEDCVFSKWNDAEDEPSPCSEQLVLPVYYRDKGDNWAPAILTFQRSGFRNTTRYLGSMKASKTAAFQVETRIELEIREKGDTVFSVPKFYKGEPTEAGELVESKSGKMVPGNWLDYYQTFEDIKAFLRRPRTRTSSDTEASEPVDSGENLNNAKPTKTPEPDHDIVDAEAEDIEPETNAAPPQDDDDDAVF